MKKIAISILCSLVLSNVLYAQSGVISMELQGKTYTVSKEFPAEILGRYLYEGKGEPIVVLEKDGTGLFQRHMVPAEKIEFWIDCDENGVVRKNFRSKQEEAEGRFGYTLLYLVTEGERKGKYDLMEVRVLTDLKKLSILGERYKPF
jgi:hypothetical protein